MVQHRTVSITGSSLQFCVNILSDMAAGRTGSGTVQTRETLSLLGYPENDLFPNTLYFFIFILIPWLSPPVMNHYHPRVHDRQRMEEAQNGGTGNVQYSFQTPDIHILDCEKTGTYSINKTRRSDRNTPRFIEPAGIDRKVPTLFIFREYTSLTDKQWKR